MTDAVKKQFFRDVWSYYDRHARVLPWRIAAPDGSFDPYKVLVSELMLQQTQVARVVPKYQEFVASFPTVAALAEAELAAVLRLWNGLGYNRRAKYLLEAARKLKGEAGAWSVPLLESCKGIGYNTAAAICVYTYNQPHIFIETNVRTVYIHHFLRSEASVSDSAIHALLEETIDKERPREFYWALMDYGAHLKRSGIKNVSQSKHYKAQSAFSGSRRQVRGEVIKVLTQMNGVAMADLRELVADKRLNDVITELVDEGLVRRDGALLKI